VRIPLERNLVLIALFAAQIAALGLVPKLTLAFGVPITAQSLGVMLCGTVLGARRGALAVLLFLLLVALGLPLLAGGRGGLGSFVSPSAGFLFGFPLAAFVAGMIVERWRAVSTFLAATVGALLGGVLVLYVPGILGMAVALGATLPEAAALAGAFVPGDLIKAVLAGLVTAALARARPGAVLSRT
jgi:biotin transport system substrate-specific component